jgi:pimeloyl-ACP methyl ester carboxylesterase
MASPTSRRTPLFTGIDCHYLEWDAAPSDHTVVLVHGFLDSGWTFQPVAEARLAERYHLVAPDMRGHGESDRVGEGGYYHFMDYVADLSALVEVAGRRRVSLVGHSMGGSVVSYLAGAFPERFHRLVLLEGIGPPEDESPIVDRVQRWVRAWEKARKRETTVYPTIEDAAKRLMQTDPLLDAELARFLAERTTRPEDGGRRFMHDPLHLTRGPHPFRRAVMDEFHRRVACPTLLVDGALSHFRPAAEETERIRRLFDDARAVVLEGAGHMMTRHQPKALADLLVDFLG